MRNNQRISVIIPALNEAQSITHVLDDIPAWVDEVIVADNGSSDDTVAIAQAHGARVVHEAHRGYGAACLRGMAALDSPEVVVFLDGDYSDHPQQMDSLVDPIVHEGVDMVIGSRTLGQHERGALTPQARFGNQLACFLMRQFWGVRHTDLGPFRAIRYNPLRALGMADRDYGWTVEMQIKAALHRLNTREVPVDYRKRIGKSKVSGTLRGVIGAGYKILSTIFISAMRYHLYEKKRMSLRRRLVIVTRYPEAGHTKTRLIPTLGAQGAADLQCAMTEHALRTASLLLNTEIEVRYTGAEESTMRAWLGEGLRYAPQHSGDLGARMYEAFEQAFESGVDQVVLMGIDCPEISGAVIETAFEDLYDRTVTLGPATDGGYYLVAANSEVGSTNLKELFVDMEWGTESVFTETCQRLEASQTSWHRLAYLNDVDRPEDVDRWESRQSDAETPLLSVIIPALNEAQTLPKTLERPLASPRVEVIVVDGGSDDETVTLAQNLGATVIEAPRGRATQMNYGAAYASADTLVFLHADTELPEGYVSTILETLERPHTACGAFRFSTSVSVGAMRWMAWGTNIRSRYWSLPYGDQAYFMRKEMFHRASGYPDVPIMEDFLFIRAMKRLGRIRIASNHISTCARRWKHYGPWRTMFLNQRVILRWYLGTSPEALAREYNQHRE